MKSTKSKSKKGIQKLNPLLKKESKEKFPKILSQNHLQKSRKHENKRQSKNQSLNNSTHRLFSTSSFSETQNISQRLKSTLLRTSPSPDRKLKTPSPFQLKKKHITKQSSSVEKIPPRLPWGCDEARLKNYVLETLLKMNKLRNNHKNCKIEQRQDKKEKVIVEKEKCSIQKLQSISPIKKQHIYEQRKSEEKEEKTEKKDAYSSTDHLPKKQKLNKQIKQSFKGQFQTIETNNLFTVSFRVKTGTVIEVEIKMLKRAQNLSVSLRKGSLQCQSINEKYANLLPKTTIMLMSPVHFIKLDSFVYPQLHLNLNQKNGTFSYQKIIILPYTWLHLINPLPISALKALKAQKIKNKSMIEDLPYRSSKLQTLMRIFHGQYLKQGRGKAYTYVFGFMHIKNTYIIRLHEKGNRYCLECEARGKGEASQIIKYFDFILNF